jgi:Asp-tRNA(Asn)/Glu-tRNA(Gln) amidotransferase A subunit family amidase
MIGRPANTASLAAVTGIAAVRRGTLDSRAWIDALLERAQAHDLRVHAWTQTVEERRRRLEHIAAADRSLPLAGLPVGVKDVIDAAGWPTQCNSPIEVGRVATASAAAVSRLEAAGAVVIGKTVTTEYAFMAPGPTTNPHDVSRTPGGSSSGSAAAVADFQAPVALTTQTGGSTIRPAAFCGIVGYKPPFGRVPTGGLALLAPSIDAIGIHARGVADIALVAAVMEVRPCETKASWPRRFLVLEPTEAEDIAPDMRAMLADAAERLQRAGSTVERAARPASFLALDAAHRVIMSVEVARSFASRYATRRTDLSASLAAFIERGQATSGQELAAAHAIVAAARNDLHPLARAGILLMPAAPGEAPVGLNSTGNAALNRLWSLLHVGVMTVPAGLGANGMPLGLQLVDPLPGAPNLFSAAAFAERALAPAVSTENAS